MSPTVSVITPAFNAEKTLQKSAVSVLNQTYRDFELIIIVNGSIDKTLEISHNIALLDNRVKVIESIKGKVPARNKGLAVAKGDFIALNDADDIWLPEKLSKQIEVLSRGVDVVGGRIRCFNENGIISPDPIDRPLQNNEIIKKMLEGTNPIANSSAIFNKDLLGHIGTYDDCFPFCEDYHFWLRAIKFAKFENIDEVLIEYFVHHSPDYDPRIPIGLASFYRSLYHYTGVIS